MHPPTSALCKSGRKHVHQIPAVFADARSQSCTFAQVYLEYNDDRKFISSTTDGLAVLSITQLVLSERESRDNGWWNRMADCFHPDARIRLSWIDGDADAFVKGSIDMARRGMKADIVWDRR